jgi:hypothetical protein
MEVDYFVPLQDSLFFFFFVLFLLLFRFSFQGLIITDKQARLLYLGWPT